MKEETKVQENISQEQEQAKSQVNDLSRIVREFDEASERLKQQAKEELVEVDEEERSNYIVVPDMFVRRTCDVKNGKKYYNYFVHGMLRGVPIKVRVRPARDSSGFTDVSAYVFLDAVFGENTDIAFAVQVLKRKDFTNNRIMKSFQYFAFSKDEDGQEYPAPLHFEMTSDKALISTMLDIANKKYDLGLPL